MDRTKSMHTAVVFDVVINPAVSFEPRQAFLLTERLLFLMLRNSGIILMSVGRGAMSCKKVSEQDVPFTFRCLFRGGRFSLRVRG